MGEFKKRTNYIKKHDKEKFLDILKGSNTLKEACEIADMSRQTHWKWMQEDSEYSAKYFSVLKERSSEIVPMAISKLKDLIDGPIKRTVNDKGEETTVFEPPSFQAIKYALDNHGKLAGFSSENQEATVQPVLKINLNL